MDDDFNTADAIASVFELVKFINTTADGSRSKEYLDTLYDILFKLTDVSGSSLTRKKKCSMQTLRAMIEKRQAEHAI